MHNQQKMTPVKQKKGYLRMTFFILFLIIALIMILNIDKVLNYKEKLEEYRTKYMSGYYDNQSKNGEIIPEPLFIPPTNWIHYEILDAFKISLPPTVELNHIDEKYIQKTKNKNWFSYKINKDAFVFQQKGVAKISDDALDSYCRIIIEYKVLSLNDCRKATDYKELNNNDIKQFQEMAKQSSKHYNIIGTPKVCWLKIKDIYGIQLNYIRENANKIRTEVFTYYFLNRNELSTITISYGLDDKNKWESSLLNIVKTFKWNKIQ